MRILLIEDDEKVASFIRNGLAQNSSVVDWATSGLAGLNMVRSSGYDAVILDLMLPDTDGLEVVREMRRGEITTPVLALSARGATEQRVEGLDAGCDDYLPKPFAFDELLARLRALHRRPNIANVPRLEYSDLTVDPVRHTVMRGSRQIELTTREYALLELLLRHPQQVLTRTKILEAVWSFDFDSGTNLLDVYIHSLRKKLEQGSQSRLIHTIRGVGFVLR